MAAAQGPLSPHLGIYKKQLTAVLSITHRATGVFLSLGALLLCYWLLSIAAGPGVYARNSVYLHAWYGQVLLFLFCLSFYYHLCNGIRHLFWDAGMGLELKTTYASGYIVVIISILLTLLTWFAGAMT
ncbi:MAG: succinate dehydrogenase, cytochrome b556 subunit [Gammaproteobacteria bacterium]|jgi:succinate dehydrogenase / fumarate reductase cytochrome b subunit